jgi:hypothetical protein
MLPSKLDRLGKVAWLAIMALGFATAWPFGLAMLAYLAGSGRLQAWRIRYAGAPGAWFNIGRGSPASGSGLGGRNACTPSSGNQVLDNYRSEALSRLEEKRRKFQAYLGRLRKARDKAEFDAFMAEWRQRVVSVDTPGLAPVPA